MLGGGPKVWEVLGLDHPIGTIKAIRHMTGWGIPECKAAVSAHGAGDSEGARKLALIYANGAPDLLPDLSSKMPVRQWTALARDAERRRLEGGREIEYRRVRSELLRYAARRGSRYEDMYYRAAPGAWR